MLLLVLVILAVLTGGLGFGGFIVAGALIFKILFFMFLISLIGAIIRNLTAGPEVVEVHRDRHNK